MAGQLSPESRLRRLRLAGWMTLAALGGALALAVALAVRASLSPRARYVVRPEQPVFGVSVGSPVRLRGAVVGEVAAVRLWQASPGAPLRPELALSLDLRRGPGLADLRSQVGQGLRVEFLPVNPASGFLEVDLVWRPGSPVSLATADPDELPTLPPAPSAVSRAARFLRAVAEGDPASAAARLGERLDAARAALGSPGERAAAARAAAVDLRALAADLERLAGPDALAADRVRLADLRERLRAAAGSLDALAGRFAHLSSALPAALGRMSALLREAAGDARGGGPDRGASPR